MLGLGDLELRDSERTQPSGGRLDLLFSDPDTLTRYEVELQLGAVDESHLVRTIEYWDTERRRYPQYEHVAVIVAEDITTRFMNVIQLLHRSVQLMAIQLQLIEFDDALLLVPTIVIEPLPLGTEEEDEGEIYDRAFWERKRSPAVMGIFDELMERVRRVEPAAVPKYNKRYIGITIDDKVRNFVSFHPRGESCRTHFKIRPSDEISEWLDGTELDVLAYGRRHNEYRVSIRQVDLSESDDALMRLITIAHEQFGRPS